jgi:thioredoxin-like negative regulator of GroEL
MGLNGMDSSQPQIDRAVSLLELGRNDEAAKILQDVMVADPTNAHALALLSRTYRKTNPQYAYQLAVGAVGLNPEGPGLHLNAAWSADAANATPMPLPMLVRSSDWIRIGQRAIRRLRSCWSR